MEKIQVRLKERSYEIIAGANVLTGLGQRIASLEPARDAYIITFPRIKKLHGAKLEDALKPAGMRAYFKVIADSESSKSFSMAGAILADIIRFGRDKRICIVAFGGGVVGDVSGFVASVYKRGVSLIQVPTTLLAQVDSAIGGKTAVDSPQAKNLVGTFYQPRLVLSDTALLSTLPARQLVCGLAEVIKYALIEDRQLFVYLRQNYRRILDARPADLEFIVGRSSRIKAAIVSRDERETKGLRHMLNFGHTLGHAIEAAGRYRLYSHGEAVGLGMLLACDISCELGMLQEKVRAQVEALLAVVGLPVKAAGVRASDVLKAHYFDKKFVGGTNRFVLLEDISRIKIVENIPLKIIKETLNKRCQT